MTGVQTCALPISPFPPPYLQERAATRLRLHDRLALGASKLIAASGPARLAAVLYAAAMHVLIFAILYARPWSCPACTCGAGAAAAAAALLAPTKGP